MPKDVEPPIVWIVDRFLNTIQEFLGLIKAILGKPNRSYGVDSTVSVVSGRWHNRHSSFEVPDGLFELPSKTKQISIIGKARSECHRDACLLG
jgi:hypothetical protein